MENNFYHEIGERFSPPSADELEPRAEALSARGEVLCNRMLEKLEAVNGFVDKDHPIYGYIDKVLRRLYGEESLPEIVVLSDSNIANALALPTGTIVITPKILKLCKTEDELAFLLAHENNHLREHHSELTERYQTNAGSLRSALKLAGMVRLNEYRSDLKPIVTVLGAAGYQPTAGATFLHSLKEEEGDSDSASHGSLRDRELNIYSLEKLVDIEGIEKAQTPIGADMEETIESLSAACHAVNPVEERLAKTAQFDPKELKRLINNLKLDPSAVDYLILAELFSEWYEKSLLLIQKNQVDPNGNKANLIKTGMRGHVASKLSHSGVFTNEHRAITEAISSIETNLYDQIEDEQERVATLLYLLSNHLKLPLLDKSKGDGKRPIEFLDFTLPSGKFLYVELLDLVMENGFKSFAELVRFDVLSSMGLDVVAGSAEPLEKQLLDMAIELESYQDPDSGDFRCSDFIADLESMIDSLNDQETKSSGIPTDQQSMMSEAVKKILERVDTEYLDLDKLLEALAESEYSKHARDIVIKKRNPEKSGADNDLEKMTSSMIHGNSRIRRERIVDYDQYARLAIINLDNIRDDLASITETYSPPERAIVYFDFFTACKDMQTVFREEDNFKELKSSNSSQSKKGRRPERSELTDLLVGKYGENSETILIELADHFFVEYLKSQSACNDKHAFFYDIGVTFEITFRNETDLEKYADMVSEHGFDNDRTWINESGVTYRKLFEWLIGQCSDTDDVESSYELFRRVQQKYPTNAINNFGYSVEYTAGEIKECVNNLHNLLSKFIAMPGLDVADKLYISRLICDPDIKNRFLQQLFDDLEALDFETLRNLAVSQKDDPSIAFRCYEILIEHKAKSPDEFDMLLTDLDDILTEQSSLAGNAVIMEPIIKLIGDDYGKIAKIAIETKSDDKPFKNEIIANWSKMLMFSDSFNSIDIEATADYMDTPKEIEDWLDDDVIDAILGSASNDQYLTPYTQMSLSDAIIDRLYYSSPFERQLISRRLLSDPDKGLLDRRAVLQDILSEIAAGHIESNVDARATVDKVIESVIAAGDEKSVFFLTSPFAARALFREPREPASMPQLVYDYLKERSEFEGGWDQRIAKAPDSLFENRWSDPEDKKYRQYREQKGAPIHKSVGDMATEKFCRLFLRQADGSDLAVESEILKGHLAEVLAEDDEKMPMMRAVVELASILGAPGVRFLQVLGQYIDIPEEAEDEFSKVYDSTFGQSRLAAYSLIKREYPKLFEAGYEIGERLGGGSLVSVYDLSGPDGRRAVARVLNPNAAYRVKESIDLLRNVVADLAKKDANNPIYKLIHDHLIPDLEQWLMSDLGDQEFENDDAEFSKWNGYKPSEGWDYSMKVPQISPTGNRFVQIEEYIDGTNLTQLQIIDGPNNLESGQINNDDYRQMVALIIRNYFDQIGDGLIHSDAHEGNFRLMPDKQVAILDRNFYLKLDDADKELLGQIFSGNVAEAFVDYLLAQENNQHMAGRRDQIIERVNSTMSLDYEKITTSIMDMLQDVKGLGLKTPLKLTLLIKNLSFLNNIAKKAGFGSLVETMFYSK